MRADEPVYFVVTEHHGVESAAVIYDKLGAGFTRTSCRPTVAAAPSSGRRCSMCCGLIGCPIRRTGWR